MTSFIDAASSPVNGGFAGGTLERDEAILTAHPQIAADSIHAAAILGDDALVHRLLERDAKHATTTGGPWSWDALTCLCFSRYLRLDRARSPRFTRAARALLDSGASANTGFFSADHQPPQFESVLYGAAGVAHDAELTALLLERGADPNDGEVVYHTPESYDNAAMRLLVESGKLSSDSLSTMLLRKHDWHDHDGIKWLLERGADPNRLTRWGYSALHQAIRRDNDIAIIELLLDHEADPTYPAHGRSAIAMAARDGRGDVLDLFERRGRRLDLRGVDQLLAACAQHDANAVSSIARSEPEVVRQIQAQGGKLLGEFAGIGNTDGIRHLLDLGVAVGAVDEDGDGYWGVANGSTALHVAAWRARHATVKLLIERGAPVDIQDGEGRTPLALAVRACVASYWTERRSPESVAALIGAGASVHKVDFPSDYAEVDELLRRHS